MKIGYARVSTKEQNIHLQIDALKKAGAQKIYSETISGTKSERPVLNDLLSNLREGDLLVIWKLDRLGRSLNHLVKLIEELACRKVGLLSLNDPIDTSSPQGRLIFNLFCSLSEFEKDLIKERTHAGLQAARARGRLGGRPKGLSKKAQEKAIIAETLYKEGVLSINQIAAHLNIGRSTLYDYLKSRKVPTGTYIKKPKIIRQITLEEAIEEIEKKSQKK